MNQKILFILTILGITLLLFLSEISNQEKSATIKSIQEKSSVTIIETKEIGIPLVIFEKNLDLRRGEKIKFKAKNSIYENKPQLIIEKIWKY